MQCIFNMLDRKTPCLYKQAHEYMPCLARHTVQQFVFTASLYVSGCKTKAPPLAPHPTGSLSHNKRDPLPLGAGPCVRERTHSPRYKPVEHPTQWVMHGIELVWFVRV